MDFPVKFSILLAFCALQPTRFNQTLFIYDHIDVTQLHKKFLMHLTSTQYYRLCSSGAECGQVFVVLFHRVNFTRSET